MTSNQKAIPSSDRAFYDQEKMGSIDEHKQWMHEIEFYFNGYSSQFNDALAGTTGLIAELGAGSCGLSVCLSRLENVKQIISVDISIARMKKMIDTSADILKGNKQKIEPVECDFNGRLPFNDGELDAIVFDAALHHTRSMWDTLGECNRALKKGGILVAQRESYLNQFRAKKQLQRLLNTPEVAAQVSENMYLQEQFHYYLTVSGFYGKFYPHAYSHLKRWIPILNNGRIFSDGYLWYSKV